MIRDLLLLMRAPLAAGAVCNVVVGWTLATGGEGGRGWPLVLGLLAAATCCLYWGGMVLNDWFDRDRDTKLAPHRPLPAGRVRPSLAAGLGFGLLAAGVASSAAAAWLAGADPTRGALAGALVATCVLVYDGWLKRYRILGSAAMASCRFTNALLPALALGLDPWLVLPYAVLLTVYVFNLTILSTYEEDDAPSGPLTAAFGGLIAVPVALAGLAVLRGGASLFALLPAAILAVVLTHQLLRSMELGTQVQGGKQTIRFLKALWWLDLSALLVALAWPALAAWASLYVLGTFGAKALYAPPPR